MVRTDRRRRSPIVAHQANDDTANPQVFLIDENRFHGRICRLKAHPAIVFAIVPLDGCLAVNQRDHRFALIRPVAALDDYVIAIANTLVHHRLTLYAQAERAVAAYELIGHRDGVLALDCLNRQSSRDLAEQRDLLRAAATGLARYLERS